MSPEDRLREISLMWAYRTNHGQPFLQNRADVPLLRDLLEGYTHPDELPDEED